MPRRRRKLAQREDHPRERLFRHGAQALSSAELVEILLRNGCPGSTARKLARELIVEYGSLIGLAGLDRAFLHRRGIGKAKAATIMAAFEIGRRIARERMPRRDLLDRPDAVASYLSLRYAQGDQETMGALYLDVRNRLIAESEVYRGTLSRAAVEPRAIFKEALLQSASGFVLFHTHPRLGGSVLHPPHGGGRGDDRGEAARPHHPWRLRPVGVVGAAWGVVSP